ncbi:MAG: hypothetical protein ACTSWN_06260 [Promethearchaeota archaeon]
MNFFIDFNRGEKPWFEENKSRFYFLAKNNSKNMLMYRVMTLKEFNMILQSEIQKANKLEESGEYEAAKSKWLDIIEYCKLFANNEPGLKESLREMILEKSKGLMGRVERIEKIMRDLKQEESGSSGQDNEPVEDTETISEASTGDESTNVIPDDMDLNVQIKPQKIRGDINVLELNESVESLWLDAVDAFRQQRFDRFFRKAFVAMESAVRESYYKHTNEPHETMRKSMLFLKRENVINLPKDELMWIWELRNKFTHEGIDLQGPVLRRARRILWELIKSCGHE